MVMSGTMVMNLQGGGKECKVEKNEIGLRDFEVVMGVGIRVSKSL
jgi:hypothetical protein